MPKYFRIVGNVWKCSKNENPSLFYYLYKTHNSYFVNFVILVKIVYLIILFCIIIFRTDGQSDPPNSRITVRNSRPSRILFRHEKTIAEPKTRYRGVGTVLPRSVHVSRQGGSPGCVARAGRWQPAREETHRQTVKYKQTNRQKQKDRQRDAKSQQISSKYVPIYRKIHRIRIRYSK